MAGADEHLPLTPAAFQILVALAPGKRHGYAIMKDIAERTGGEIKLNPGTLYTTIKRLLEDELISEAAADERRRYYAITSLGRRVAEAEVARLNALIDRAAATLRTKTTG